MGSSMNDTGADASEVPSSPEISRAGARRRRLTSGSADTTMSLSEDDTLPEVSALVAGPSKSRLVRERPIQAPALTTTPSLPSPEKFYGFKLAWVGEPESRIRGAWMEANGDQTRAQALMRDRNWTPAPPPTPSVAKPVEKDVGRVKEVEEANKAQRAAIREKGKMSAIYANRPAVITTPSAAKPTVVPDSPTTPFIPTRGKRVKKLVLSESEEESDEDSLPEIKKPRIATHESRVLDYFNTRTKAALQELTGMYRIFSPSFLPDALVGCSSDQADIIIDKRPYTSKDDFFEKLGQGKKKAGPAGLSPKLFDDSVSIFKGYGSVDTILEDCERIGVSLRTAIASWSTPEEKSASTSDLPGDEVEEGALSLRSLGKGKEKKNRGFLSKQPPLAKGIQLKDYQLLGVNWLNLLYRRKLSCILADEMGASWSPFPSNCCY